MLRLALMFLVVGLLAALLGFTSIAGASFALARLPSFAFLTMLLVLLVAGLLAARKLTNV